ncbi:MAG: hypothetical protein DLM64_07885, partial [Solirubrobacterales bacterium]
MAPAPLRCSDSQVSLVLIVIIVVAGLALIAGLIRSAQRAERERGRLAATIEHLAEGLIVTE